MASFLGRIGAAMDAFRTYGLSDDTMASLTDNYALLLSFWSGSWSEDGRIQSQKLRRATQRLYKATCQEWRHADAVVSLYEQFVYTGELPRNPEDLTDVEGCAIPIDPQAGPKTANDNLLAAIAAIFPVWNYQQNMVLRPKFSAILGDGLVELKDDPKRGFVYPNYIPPWYVTDLQLDEVGNVKAYTVEWDVVQQESKRYNAPIAAEKYHFTKEVNGSGFWYFKDDRPHPDFGDGSGFEPNPYAFAPAIWDRHEELPDSNRGMSSIQKTMQQTLMLNSVLSHALDYQRKQFAAPIGLVDGPAGQRIEDFRKKIMAALGATEYSADRTAQDIMVERAIENVPLMPLGEKGSFVALTFDVGKTVEMLQLLMDSIVAENPEARYGQELLKMSQVTGPGAERILAPIVGKVNKSRGRHDPNTVKQLQMAISMISFQLANKGYPADIVSARPDRYKPFGDYDLTSYGRGLLDFGIKSRPVFARSQEERAQLMVLIESLTTEYGLSNSGVPDDDIQAILGEREKRRQGLALNISGIGAGSQNEDTQSESSGETGPNGPTGPTGVQA